jgi:hypothetical protein
MENLSNLSEFSIPTYSIAVALSYSTLASVVSMSENPGTVYMNGSSVALGIMAVMFLLLLTLAKDNYTRIYLIANAVLAGVQSYFLSKYIQKPGNQVLYVYDKKHKDIINIITSFIVISSIIYIFIQVAQGKKN